MFFIGFLVLAFTAFSFVGWSTYRQIKSASPRLPVDLSGEVDPEAKIAVFEGKQIAIPEIALVTGKSLVLGTTNGNKWIEVDLSDQKVRAWEGSSLFLESLISTGLPWWPTPKGEFAIWSKARATKMEGGSGRYYYNLPNVPYVMFFENADVPGYRGFSLHGTYWHNDFGRVHSHGCINLPTPIAEKLYYWTEPLLASGKSYTRANQENPGTRIVIHD